MKTCKYCGNQYEDYHVNWHNKYCCSECFRNRESKYHVGDTVYSYYNTKTGKNGILTAILTEAKVTKVYTQYRPTLNGLYQYALSYYNPKYDKSLTIYRFIHQIFTNKEECNIIIDKLNKQRQIMRSARDLMKNLGSDESVT